MARQRGEYRECIAVRRWVDGPDTWHVIRGPSKGYYPTFYHYQKWHSIWERYPAAQHFSIAKLRLLTENGGIAMLIPRWFEPDSPQMLHQHLQLTANLLSYNKPNLKAAGFFTKMVNTVVFSSCVLETNKLQALYRSCIVTLPPQLHPSQGVKIYEMFFFLAVLYCCFDRLNLHATVDTHTHSHSATPVL